MGIGRDELCEECWEKGPLVLTKRGSELTREAEDELQVAYFFGGQ